MRRVTARSGRVAVIGAGASNLVRELDHHGYAIVAVDISPVALRQLETTLHKPSRIELTVADVRSVQLDELVDTWHDRAVFHFFTAAADQDAYVLRVRSTLRVGGHVVLATFAPDGPEQCSGLPVARHDTLSISERFGEAFAVVDSFELDHHTPWGTPQRFTHIVLRHVGAP